MTTIDPKDHVGVCTAIGAQVIEQVNRYNAERAAAGLEPCVFVLLLWPNASTDAVASSSNATERPLLAKVLKFVANLWSQNRGTVRGVV